MVHQGTRTGRERLGGDPGPRRFQDRAGRVLPAEDLERGDKVAVKLSDDSVAHYQVVRVAQYANEDFPAPKVYAKSAGRPALNLVTCGGKYDREAGGYQSNVVVFTKYLWATGRTT